MRSCTIREVTAGWASRIGMQNAKKFIAVGVQTASGVPLQCGERADFMSFRIGLFGLDKLRHVDRTVAQLAAALDRVAAAA